MKTVGLIVEYNPFHNGHLHHLLESKQVTSSECAVAVMSGNFLQRGEPALLDKWTRAKMAVDNGVDLVLELPFIFASSSAEYFASGAVKLLDSLGVIDSLSFGSEAGDTSILNDIADVLVDEPDLFKDFLKEFLDQGKSFPKARSLAIIEFFKSSSYQDIDALESVLYSPNNILAIEYMKSLKNIGSSIEPFTIKRTASNYHDKDINGSICSATSIREDFFKNKSLCNTKNVVPSATYQYMKEFLDKNSTFNDLENFTEIFLYLFRVLNYDKINFVNGIEEGLENRILKAFNNSNTLSSILEAISTKRYTMTRIKRILIHALIGLDKETFNTLNAAGPRYVRVLASNKKGLELLGEIKKKSSIPIITKYSNHQKLDDDLLNKMIDFDKRATDLYFTGLSKFTKHANMNLDFLKSPYILKNKPHS